MLRVNEFRFFELSTKLRAVNVQPESLYKDVILSVYLARKAIQDLLDHDVPVKVCRPDAEKLIEVMTEIVPLDWKEIFQKVKDDGDKPVERSAGSKLKSTLADFETVLKAECGQLDTYFVSQKGAYSTADLVEHAELILPESVRADVSARAVSDIQAAGRCLAFDNPTAAGFHLLRAVESVMADFYFHVVGKKIPTRMRNWGIYIKRLKKEETNSKVVGILDHIRENYRNPITHPDVFLTSEDAEVLFGVGTSAITIMIRVMQTPSIPQMATSRTPK